MNINKTYYGEHFIAHTNIDYHVVHLKLTYIICQLYLEKSEKLHEKNFLKSFKVYSIA